MIPPLRHPLLLAKDLATQAEKAAMNEALTLLDAEHAPLVTEIREAS